MYEPLQFKFDEIWPLYFETSLIQTLYVIQTKLSFPWNSNQRGSSVVGLQMYILWYFWWFEHGICLCLDLRYMIENQYFDGWQRSLVADWADPQKQNGCHSAVLGTSFRCIYFKLALNTNEICKIVSSRTTLLRHCLWMTFKNLDSRHLL